MPQVAIATDSIACLPRELVTQHGIEIIPINFFAGGRVYRDWVDINPSEAYELFLADPDSFKTSAASPEDCLRAFRRAGQRVQGILCVTISATLSTMYQSALEAKELAGDEMPGVSIEVMDSLTATAAEGMVALAAARAAAGGSDLAAVTAAAAAVRDRVDAILYLDTIRHVYRSGRIPRIASQIGSALNIRPVLTVCRGVHFSGVVRNRHQGMERVLQAMRGKAGGAPLHVAVMHAYAPDEAEKLKERIAAEFPCAELWLTEFSPVMGYTCGTGTVGAAFYAGD